MSLAMTAFPSPSREERRLVLLTASLSLLSEVPVHVLVSPSRLPQLVVAIEIDESMLVIGSQRQNHGRYHPQESMATPRYDEMPYSVLLPLADKELCSFHLVRTKVLSHCDMTCDF